MKEYILLKSEMGGMGKRKGRKGERKFNNEKKRKKNFRTWYVLMMDVVEMCGEDGVYGCYTWDLWILYTKSSSLYTEYYVEVRPMRKKLRVYAKRMKLCHRMMAYFEEEAEISARITLSAPLQNLQFIYHKIYVQDTNAACACVEHCV